MTENSLPKLLYYANMHWPIFPCHGKQPLTPHGFKDASTNPNIISRWFNENPDANWAIATGPESGLFVLDIDKRSGGLETFEGLRNEYPEPIETITVRTGGGGLHYWFAWPDGQDISSRSRVWPGIDIKASGGYVLVPPSKTDAEYKFILSPKDTNLAIPPAWIMTAVTKNGKSEHIKLDAAVPEGKRHDTLIQTAGKMRRLGMDEAEIKAALFTLRDERFNNGNHPITDKEVSDIAAFVASKPVGYALSDLGNAERFADQNNDDVRYCHVTQSWLLWDDTRWKADDTGELYRRAYDTVRSIYTEAAGSGNEDARKALGKWAMGSESRQRIEAMLHLAKPYLSIQPDKLDQHPMLLNVENGEIDLTTGDLLEHKKSHFITKLAPVYYRPNAESPSWNSFLKMITGGDEQLELFHQLAIGYTLTGKIDEHCLFFLHGLGANGKTTYTEVLRLLLGDYAARIDIEALMASYNSGMAANPYVASLAGARFVVASEVPENRRLNEALIKVLTGGDSLTARYLFSNPFTFQPTHKIWIHGNHKPKTGGSDDYAFWRRMKVVPFSVTIPEDQRRPMSEVLEQFKSELSGILNWALLGCVLWQTNKLDSDAVKRATNEYRTESDLVQQFLDECCQMHPDFSIEKDKVYSVWRGWCDEQGEVGAAKRSKRWLTFQLIGKGFTSGGHADNSIIGLKVGK